MSPRPRLLFAALGIAALAFAAAPTVHAQTGDTTPTLVLDTGFGDTVTAIATPVPLAVLSPVPQSKPDASQLECPQKDGTVVLTGPATTAHGVSYCITATLQSLNVRFQLPSPFAFVTPANLNCTRLRGASNLIGVTVLVGTKPRAECDLDAGFLYALAVETQGDPAFVPVKPNTPHGTWTFAIPWTVLHLGRHATELSVMVNGMPNPIAVQINRADAGFLSADYAPIIRLNAPPSTGSAPARLHDVEINANYSLGTQHLFAGSFAQNQSTVSVQRALSQALSLAPMALPTAQTQVVIGQDLQTQSQTLFAFQQPSTYLEDQSLKPLVDALPFSVTKLSSLAAGYAYGYASEVLNAGAFYGLASPGSYSRAETVTVIAATPPPRPTPSPSPTPTPRVPPLNPQQVGAVNHRPLQPPAPPAPLFESSTASTSPFQLSLLNGVSATPTTRDTIDALAFEAHLFDGSVPADAGYQAQTFNVFGRLEHDYHLPLAPLSPSATSQFLGESATFTTGAPAARGTYLQVRETVAVQQNDRYFSPTAGTATWISSLDGPIAHFTASLASGEHARYYALDLFGFRLTNVNGDIAAQSGWQITVPLISSKPGWLLSGGGETQVVSDRIAAVEQGLLANYASTIAQVTKPAIRPQRLGNVRVDSPQLPGAISLKFTVGYDFGTVTACGTTLTSRANAPQYQCLTVTDNRIVGGAFVTHGKLSFGATDTAVASGTVAAADAARNLGTSGGLPGSTSMYLTYSLCPKISLAYTNAAFPTSVPLPQQGATLSGEVDVPVTVGNAQSDLIFGYFNEHTSTVVPFNESGFSAVLRIGTTFRRPKPGLCNWP